VAHHKDVGLHRNQVIDGVNQTLAFGVDEVEISKLITSADKRLAAISKVVRVRVEFSKKRLNTLLPRSSGNFFYFTCWVCHANKLLSRIQNMQDLLFGHTL
jgi:hypothetical protein